MFLWFFSNYCPLNLLLVRSHHAKIIIVKRLIQGCYNVARVRVELRSCDQGCRKNDAFILPATLPTKNQKIAEKWNFSSTELLGLCFVVVVGVQMCNQKSRRQTFFPPCLARLTHIPPCTFRAGNLCSTRFYYAWVILCFFGRVNQAPCVGLSCNHTQDTLGTVL